MDADPEHGGGRRPRRRAAAERAAGGRARLGSGLRRPRGDVPRRRTDGRRRRAAVAAPAAGRARAAAHGPAEHRRLGAARGSDGLGVRRGGPRRGSRRRDRRRLRRPRARREPAGRGSARRGLASSPPWLACPVAQTASSSDRKEPRMRERPYTLLSCCVVDRRLHRQRGVAAAPLERRRLRPGRRGARLLRRDPGRGGDGADRQPPAARALGGSSRGSGRPRPAGVADQGDGDPARRARRPRRLLQRRRRREDRLLREPGSGRRARVVSARSRPSSTPATASRCARSAPTSRREASSA